MNETGVIDTVVLGGTKATLETKNISKAVNLTETEIDLVKDLLDKNYSVEIRMVEKITLSIATANKAIGKAIVNATSGPFPVEIANDVPKTPPTITLGSYP